MPTPQRISLIEAYDNRDVVAWLVRHSTEIEELKTAVEALPENNEFVLTIGDQTISGTKSFMNKIVAAGGIEADTLLKINADLQVFGDIYQNGSAYDTHAEQLYTTKDYILMRDGAVTGLAPGAMSGLEVIKYDGTNNLRLAADASGVARIGDVGDEQPLLTRAEAADLTDGDPLCWDSTDQKAVPFTIAAGQNIVISQQTHGITIDGVGASVEWVKRTPSNDWTDMFEIVDGCIRAKSNIYMYLKNEGMGIYIPKDLTMPTGVQSNQMYFHVPYTYNLNNNSMVTMRKITISEGNLTASTLNTTYRGCVLTIVDGNITVTPSTNLGNGSLSKSDLQIYVSG